MFDGHKQSRPPNPEPLPEKNEIQSPKNTREENFFVIIIISAEDGGLQIQQRPKTHQHNQRGEKGGKCCMQHAHRLQLALAFNGSFGIYCYAKN